MSEKLKWQLFLIILLVAAAGYFAYPADKKIFGGEKRQTEPGIDLAGGAELRVGLKTDGLKPDEIAQGIIAAKDVITRRVNIYGLKEPRIQVYGDNQILIQLPGQDMAEMERVKKIILSTGKLEFKLQAARSSEEIYKERPIPPDQKLKWYERLFGQHREVDRVLVEDEVVFDGTNILVARPNLGGKRGGWIVNLELDEWGTKKLAELSGKYSEDAIESKGGNKKDARRLAIILDDKLVSAPTLQANITDGKCFIEGDFNQESASELGIVLKSGKLPAPLEIIGENLIGPSLGADSVNRGKISFILAALAVMAFMLIYYRGAGLIANIALIMNLVLILGILSFFKATLTLPGIAGLILTMGMAVDANIIFYERIREEKEKGKEIRIAFESGFTRALVTVLDSNLTTLLAGIILYYISDYYGIDSIKGFALTLSIGIFTTLFTGYFASRVMLQLCVEGGLIKKFSMLRFFTNPNFDFMKKAPLFVGISVVAVILSLALFFMRGGESLGIDFTGGSIVHIKFQDQKDITEIRTACATIVQADGQPKYQDLEIQPVLPAITATGQATVASVWQQGGNRFDEFQIRTRYAETGAQREELKNDLKKLFINHLPPEPLVGLQPVQDALILQRGYKLEVTVNLREPVISTTLQSKLQEKHLDNPWVTTPENTGGKQYHIYFKENDELDIKKTLKEVLPLTEDPFPTVSGIGTAAAGNLKQGSVIALILSWIGIIIYLAFRFELKYGIAAVIAIIHDVLISLGGVIAFNWLAPASWGIQIDLGLVSIAAFLTIIGYSVNDTIVIFDRIRENVQEMKNETMTNIINRSINQTMGRSIITSTTVFLTVLVLFLVTAHSGSGIANFAFPLIVGVISGSYSTIFIAGPIVNLFSKK
ncbi:MAG: protein translocase subunit SecD [Planctomycetota bacterium]